MDNAACFAAPGTVLLAWTDDPSDPQYDNAVQNLAALEAARDARGRRLQVVRVPMPWPPVRLRAGAVEAVRAVGADRPGDRLPASYINHYIANGAVIVPQFGGEQVGPGHRVPLVGVSRSSWGVSALVAPGTVGKSLVIRAGPGHTRGMAVIPQL